MAAKIIFIISGIMCIIAFFFSFNPFVLSTGLFLFILGVKSRIKTTKNRKRRQLYELKLRLKGKSTKEIEKRMRLMNYFG